jgi:hypothetical protein
MMLSLRAMEFGDVWDWDVRDGCAVVILGQKSAFLGEHF